MAESLERIGKLLAEKREGSGLTQAQVAKKLGYTTAQFVSNWERGLSYPPIKAIPTISKLYKVPAKVIFEAVLKTAIEMQEQAMRKEFASLKRRGA